MPCPPIDSNAICRACGACCANYRVSFYWAEAEARGLAEEWTEKRDHFQCFMAGTNQAKPRCRALQGVLGQAVTCQVYAHRPGACRELIFASEQCQQARAAHGLPPVAAS